MAILDIQTDNPRETVSIDGRDYALADFEGFSTADQLRLKRDGNRITVLADKDDISDDEISEMQNLTDALFDRIAGDIPDDLRKKLQPGARIKITNAYFLAFKAVMKTAASPATENDSGNLSRESSDSMAQAHQNG